MPSQVSQPSVPASPKPIARMSVAKLCQKFNEKGDSVADMNNLKCGKCAKLSFVRCAECVADMKSIVRCGEARHPIKWSKMKMIHPKGAKVREQTAKMTTKFSEEVYQGEILKNVNLSSPSQHKNILHTPFQDTTFAGEVGRGKTGMGEIFTPTKRKLLEEKPVSKLLPVFDSTRVLPVPSPRGDYCGESPAKRSRLCTPGQ